MTKQFTRSCPPPPIVKDHLTNGMWKLAIKATFIGWVGGEAWWFAYELPRRRAIYEYYAETGVPLAEMTHTLRGWRAKSPLEKVLWYLNIWKAEDHFPEVYVDPCVFVFTMAMAVLGTEDSPLASCTIANLWIIIVRAVT